MAMPAIVCPKLAAFDALWRGQAALRAIPRRSDFTPRLLAPFLLNLTFVERCLDDQGRRRYRHRLFGSALAEKMGNCTGKYLEDIVPAEKVANWTRAYDAATMGNAPLHFLTPFGLPGMDHLMIETLLAPVATDNDARYGFLGIAYFFARVPPSQ